MSYIFIFFISSYTFIFLFFSQAKGGAIRKLQRFVLSEILKRSVLASKQVSNDRSGGRQLMRPLFWGDLSLLLASKQVTIENNTFENVCLAVEHGVGGNVVRRRILFENVCLAVEPLHAHDRTENLLM